MRIVLASLMFLPAAIAAQNSVPVPRVNPAGPALTFDFPGMRIGVAEYDEGPTGTTVFYFPGKVVAAVDVRGGAPGTIFTDALRLGIRERRLDGVVFSGGSAYGLAAATGAAAALKPQRVRDGQWARASADCQGKQTTASVFGRCRGDFRDAHLVAASFELESRD